MAASSGSISELCGWAHGVLACVAAWVLVYVRGLLVLMGQSFLFSITILLRILLIDLIALILFILNFAALLLGNL